MESACHYYDTLDESHATLHQVIWSEQASIVGSTCIGAVTTPVALLDPSILHPGLCILRWSVAAASGACVCLPGAQQPR